MAVLLEQINPSRLDLRKAQGLFRLSPREIEAIQALRSGMTDKEIAWAMGISPETARGYLKTVRAKLGVSSRTAILHKLLSV
ncbi:MAG: helix-turn-helix transcriptional regulator [Candidatus Methylomirabilales bacterium]